MLINDPNPEYSGNVERYMKMYDDHEEYSKTHLNVKPKDMKEVSFGGFSKDSIEDCIHIECVCGEDVYIDGGCITLCVKCGRGYKVISYIAQYEKRD